MSYPSLDMERYLESLEDVWYPQIPPWWKVWDGGADVSHKPIEEWPWTYRVKHERDGWMPRLEW